MNPLAPGRICRVDHCWCLSLRSGVLVIAVVDMVMDCVGLLIGATEIAQMSGRYIQNGKHEDSWVVASLCMDIFISTFDFVIAGVFITGIIKDKVRRILVWWWWTVGQTFGGSVIFIVYLIKTDLVRGIAIVAYAFIAALFIYFLIVVRSYMATLQNKKYEPRELPTDEESLEDEQEDSEEEVVIMEAV